MPQPRKQLSETPRCAAASAYQKLLSTVVCATVFALPCPAQSVSLAQRSLPAADLVQADAIADVEERILGRFGRHKTVTARIVYAGQFEFVRGTVKISVKRTGEGSFEYASVCGNPCVRSRMTCNIKTKSNHVFTQPQVQVDPDGGTREQFQLEFVSNGGESYLVHRKPTGDTYERVPVDNEGTLRVGRPFFEFLHQHNHVRLLSEKTGDAAHSLDTYVFESRRKVRKDHDRAAYRRFSFRKSDGVMTRISDYDEEGTVIAQLDFVDIVTNDEHYADVDISQFDHLVPVGATVVEFRGGDSNPTSQPTREPERR